MALLWHIVRKDLFYLRFRLLMAMVTIVGGSICLGILFAQGPGVVTASSQAVKWALYVKAIPVAILVIVYGLYLELPLADPLARADAFWITRPISRWRLLGAKLLVAAICLGVLMGLAIMSRHLFLNNRGANAQSFGELSIHLWLMLAAFLIGSMFARIRSCVLATLITIVIVAVAAAQWSGISRGEVADYAAIYARDKILDLVIPLAGVLIVLHRYLSQNPKRSRILGVLVVIGIAGIAYLWPWHWPAYRFVETSSFANNSEVRLSMGEMLLINKRSSLNVEEAFYWDYFLEGLPRGYLGVPLASEHVWTNQAGKSVKFFLPPYQRLLETGDVVKAAFGAEENSRTKYQFIPELNRKQKGFFKTGTYNYEATVPLQIFKAEPLLEVALKTGAKGEAGDCSLMIDKVSVQDGSVNISFFVRSAKATGRRVVENDPYDVAPDILIMLVNRRLGLSIPYSSGEWSYATSSIDGAYDHCKMRLKSPLPSGVVLDEDALRDMVVVMVGFKSEGILIKKLSTSSVAGTPRR